MIPQRQTILMCQPDYYGIDYVINAWMVNQIGQVDRDLAVRQWQNLRQALTPHAELVFVPSKPGVPDMVFTANGGLVSKNRVIVSHFHSPERQAEEPFFRTWFDEQNFELLDWPSSISFEGAGDALFDRAQDLLWCGYGFRSDARAATEIEKKLDCRSVVLKLVDPHFYHLDTCLCPLEDGWLMYFPGAFDQASQERILATVPAEKRIVVSAEDAGFFACNAVELSRHIFMNNASEHLQNQLRQAGFAPVITPLSEYLKAGGGAKCLTLKLVEP